MQASRTATPTPAPEAPASGDGLCAVYWNWRAGGGPCGQRIERSLDFDWGSGGPGICGVTDFFMARYTGLLQAPQAGSYTLYLQGDDGYRLWAVNPADNREHLLIDRWVLQAQGEAAAPLPFSLGAGALMRIRVEYFEYWNAASCRLSWEGPGIPKQPIPQARLFSGSCVQGLGGPEAPPPAPPGMQRPSPKEREAPALAMPSGKILASLPNPAWDRAQARFSLAEGGKVRLVVSTFSDVALLKDLGHLGPGLHQAELGLEGLAEGLYFLSLLVDRGQGFKPEAHFKVVKKRS